MDDEHTVTFRNESKATYMNELKVIRDVVIALIVMITIIFLGGMWLDAAKIANGITHQCQCNK